MAKSRETWSKKETAKRKEKKRKDKEKKKEERSSSAKDGKSLDDMIAYVDEYGNITSTRPDPDDRKKIKSEDILVGVPKRDDSEEENLVREGIITFFNEDKGYGFIRDLQSQESIFFHVNEVLEPVAKDNKVTFGVESKVKGKSAVGVKLLK